MKTKRWIIFVAPPAGVLFVWLFGELVKYLWNTLLPPLFGWHPIGFWQALGLLLLCRILFGNWSSGGSGPKPERIIARRLDNMTPEEREKFRERMRARCGDFGAPGSETKEPA